MFDLLHTVHWHYNKLRLLLLTKHILPPICVKYPSVHAEEGLYNSICEITFIMCLCPGKFHKHFHLTISASAFVSPAFPIPIMSRAFSHPIKGSARCVQDKGAVDIRALAVPSIIQCRAYIFPIVKNVPIDVSAHAQ